MCSSRVCGCDCFSSLLVKWFVSSFFSMKALYFILGQMVSYVLGSLEKEGKIILMIKKKKKNRERTGGAWCSHSPPADRAQPDPGECSSAPQASCSVVRAGKIHTKTHSFVLLNISSFFSKVLIQLIPDLRGFYTCCMLYLS